MPEPVDRSPDGTPRSARIPDVDRSGALERARHVFLAGCGLPAAWAGRPQWRILETGFGPGLNFLAAWRAWKDDPRRPALLHFVSIEACPVGADDLLRSAADHPELLPLARELAQRWWGLVPGFHRLAFEDGHVLLTLCIGDAAPVASELRFPADAVFLDGFGPQGKPERGSPALLAEVARCCRPGTTLATATAAGPVRRDLEACGFSVGTVAGPQPGHASLRARFTPASPFDDGPRAVAGSAVVVGGGLAGAAAAASLARRGWSVQVLDMASEPASGASGLPAGLLAPHTSADDHLLSRLSRAGVRTTLQEAQRLLGTPDWQASGVREWRAEPKALPEFGPEGTPWQQREDGAVWHAAAAWIRPAALVRAWLAQPGVQWRGGVRVQALRQEDGQWQLLDEEGRPVAQAGLVVLAAALGTAGLAPRALPLHPVRGQVSFGPAEGLHGLPAHPLNGNGHFLPSVPLSGGPVWLCGSSYGRGDRSTEPRAEDHAANFARLQTLCPDAARQLQPAFAAGAVQAWTGVRCASSDRRPLVGELAPGLWTSTAMGSRGLTFAALAAELLAARLHGEPLPLPARLAAALDVQRVRGGAAAT